MCCLLFFILNPPSTAAPAPAPAAAAAATGATGAAAAAGADALDCRSTGAEIIAVINIYKWCTRFLLL